MRSALLSPRWIGLHVLAVLALVVCVAGTYWQSVRAFEPDRDVVTNPVADLSGAEELDAVLVPGEYAHPDSYANTAVTTTGTFDTGGQLLVPRARDGVEGFDVVLPLVTGDGVALAVNRGWTEDPDDVPDAPAGEVTVAGWLVPPTTAADGIVPVDVPEGQVERIAPSVLVNEWDYRLYEGHLTLPESDPATDALVPAPPPEPPTGITINWRSLSYTFQWALFGLSAVAYWAISVRRELLAERSRRDEGGEDAQETAQAAAGS
ncbi:cytochrome oxidase assembly protein ShyY1 [Nocardiopsis sp. Huas11]|uniref:SURF1 family protein n=1 Tax=Nocardiopsis sp. Huas11 TaxID=2183912 RepID=UPI000EAC02B5|nr:SURF1 family cytochrome oxidase biogenesis protein [Nocardiopsis sp. Huas11]RKS06329.1 cytochrome oxidase assembly protein ShyY1 [Nocardiopsis sp. Huas11]